MSVWAPDYVSVCFGRVVLCASEYFKNIFIFVCVFDTLDFSSGGPCPKWWPPTILTVKLSLNRVQL